MPRLGKGKVGLYVSVHKILVDNFKQMVKQKHNSMFGLSEEIELAMEWSLAQWTQNGTKPLVPTPLNPPSKVYHCFREVKGYLKDKFGYLIFRQAPRKHLEEAIAQTRGSDRRTVLKWMGLFTRFGLIKYLSGEVFEIL